VVNFVAETFDANPLRWLGMGVMGGFLGHYERLDFHEKTRDYELLEDRDLWLVQFNLTSEQRQALDDELIATDGRWYPYTFFSKNCAYYLQLLLANSTQMVPAPKGFTSPTDVVAAIQNSELSGPSYFRPAASRRLARKSTSVDEDVITRLKNETWTELAADTLWLEELPGPEREFVQEFFAWKILRSQSPVEEGPNRGLAFLRLLNVRDGPIEESHDSGEGLGESIPSPVFHRYTRFRLSYLDEGTTDPARVSLRYRAALHDEADPWLAHNPLNLMEFLAIEASAPINQFNVRLDELVLFSQRSLSPSDWITSRNSWMLEALARRGGLFGKDILHIEARVGFGKTFQVFPRFFAYGLVTAAGVGHCCDQAAFAPGLEVGLSWLTASRWRQGLRFTREYDVSDWSRDHQRISAWVRYDLRRSWGVNVSGDMGPLGKYVVLSLDWYP
jgi:hypothetical protein